MPSQVDRRDVISWVVVELTRQGEIFLEEGDLEGWLRTNLRLDKSHPIFIPATKYNASGKTVTVHVMEGYVFIANGLPEVEYFRLESEPYVKKILSSKLPNGMRCLQVIPDGSVQSLRQQLRQNAVSDIKIGMPVRVTEGTFSNLVGIVTDIQEDNAYIHVGMRSLDLLACIPKIFLESAEALEAE